MAESPPAATVQAPPEDPKEPFIVYLENLRDNSRRRTTAMITLRRALGYRFFDAPTAAVAYVLPWCGREPQHWRDDCHLIVASLFASHRISWTRREGDTRPVPNLGASMARLRMIEGERVDRQLAMLILADRDTIDHYLSGIVRQLAKAEIAIDWSTLLADLRAWWPEGAAARRWARAYARSESESEEEQDNG